MVTSLFTIFPVALHLIAFIWEGFVILLVHAKPCVCGTMILQEATFLDLACATSWSGPAAAAAGRGAGQEELTLCGSSFCCQDFVSRPLREKIVRSTFGSSRFTSVDLHSFRCWFVDVVSDSLLGLSRLTYSTFAQISTLRTMANPFSIAPASAHQGLGYPPARGRPGHPSAAYAGRRRPLHK